MENENAGEFNIHEAAEEIIAQGDSTTASTDDSSLSEGQSNQDSQKTGEEKELSPEEILNQVAQEQADPEALKDLLEKINAMGAVHAGMPIKVDTPEKLKQLLEMGAGFYAKTEAHANDVKAKTEEFTKMETQLKEREGQLAQKEQEIQQAVFENNIMEEMLLEWQNSDPELFKYLSQAYQQKVMAHERNRPLQQKYEGELKQLKTEIQNIKGQKQNEELNSVKQVWEKELSEVQSRHAASLGKLGVKANWDKVKEAWAADASGNMTVEQAFNAVHGEDIRKAFASYNNLLKTKNKSNQALLGRTGVGAGQKGGEEKIKAGVGDYESILRQASANF